MHPQFFLATQVPAEKNEKKSLEDELFLFQSIIFQQIWNCCLFEAILFIRVFVMIFGWQEWQYQTFWKITLWN